MDEKTKQGFKEIFDASNSGSIPLILQSVMYKIIGCEEEQNNKEATNELGI